MSIKELSPNEKKFIEDGVACNIRVDGRGRLDHRFYTIETGLLTQANGSCKLSLEQTQILVGVKAEIGDPDPSTPDLGKVLFSVECCPSAAPEFEGKGADELNIELAKTMERLILRNSALSDSSKASSSSLDLRRFCISKGELCWILYVDILVLDAGGNLFDAISIAVRAALATTKIPHVKIVKGEGDEKEIEVSDLPEDFWQPDVSNFPICTSFFKIGSHYLMDANTEEEMCMKVRMTVAVNRLGNIFAILKGGQGTLHSSEILEIIPLACKMGTEVVSRLDEVITREASLRKSEPCKGFFAAT